MGRYQPRAFPALGKTSRASPGPFALSIISVHGTSAGKQLVGVTSPVLTLCTGIIRNKHTNARIERGLDGVGWGSPYSQPACSLYSRVLSACLRLMPLFYSLSCPELEHAKRTIPTCLLAFQQRFNRVVVDAARQNERC